VSTKSDFHPSDIYYHLLDLSELMKATYEILHEVEYARQDGSRIDELDRVAGMHRIATRSLDRICEMAEILDGPSPFLPSLVGKSGGESQ